MIPQLRTALYVTGKTVTGLSATNLFHLEAKQNTAMPYCVFKDVATPRDFDSGSSFETAVVQFSLFNRSLGAIETISTALQAVFDFGKDDLSVTGYDVVTCRQLTGPLSIPIPTGGRQIVLQYRIEVQKSR